MSRAPARRWPAEWETHDATWIGWPHHEPDWPGKFEAIPWVYAEIVRVLHRHEPVHILCSGEEVREQALRLTREEVPHALTADVVEIEEGHVHVRLYTETESQKQILIGKGGSMVREIGRAARPFVEQLLGRKVYLQLQVKASPKWRRNETMLERLGL